ncbi:MAG: redoxin domain-containing protein [Bdellovibrionales bacterium]|nr:redoxin domain-containing protein [Bdellovibrionales bacterium]
MKKVALLTIFWTFIAHASVSLPVEGQNLLTDKTVKASVENKKGLVVVFLSAVCPCSNSHVAELTKISNEYPDFNFIAIHSNANEEVAVAKNYFTDKKLPFPVIQDSKAKLADEFKALKTPHVYVVRPNGEIAYQGGVTNSADCSKADKNFLRDALDDIKQSHVVRTPSGRTLGCVIKRG